MEAAAGRDPALEVREREARAEEAGRGQAAVCGIAALAEGVAREQGSAQVRVEGREAALGRVEVEGAGLDRVGPEVGQRAAVRVEAAQARVRV